MIGSHNTFSYLTPTKWWMKLLTPWHKCQELSIYSQWLFYNTKYIDIRIRFINNKPYLVHNNIIYKEDAIETIFDSTPLVKGVKCRVILDIRKKPKDAELQVELFKKLLKQIDDYPYLELDEARVFWDWSHPIKISSYKIKEYHTSVISKWYNYIKGTKWFVRKYNNTIKEEEKQDKNTVYLIDYVNI